MITTFFTVAYSFSLEDSNTSTATPIKSIPAKRMKTGSKYGQSSMIKNCSPNSKKTSQNAMPVIA